MSVGVKARVNDVSLTLLPSGYRSQASDFYREHQSKPFFRFDSGCFTSYPDL